MNARSVLTFLGALFLILNSMSAAESAHYISLGEYADFLNDVGASDPHHLYDGKMAVGAALFREGTPGNYCYKAEGAEKSLEAPILFLSYNDLIAYCAWKNTNDAQSFSLQPLASSLLVDEELKINDLDLFLEDSAGASAEQNSGHQISHSTEMWIGLGVFGALLGGGCYCLRERSDETRGDSLENSRERIPLVLGDTRYYASVNEGGLTTDLRNKTVSSNNYFTEQRVKGLLLPDHAEMDIIAGFLNSLRSDSRERQNLISCLPRDSGINKAYLTFCREQHFNSVIREELQKSEDRVGTVKIIEEINLQREKPTTYSDYFSLRSIIPNWFSLRHDNPIVRALEGDEGDITSEQKTAILNAVIAARKELEKPREVQQALSQGVVEIITARVEEEFKERNSQERAPTSDPAVIREQYPYITQKEVERIAADPNNNPIPPVGLVDNALKKMGVIKNPEDQIRDKYIYEVVNLINKTKEKNKWLRKVFFKQEVTSTRVTPMTRQLLRQINSNGSRFLAFDLQDSGWIAKSLENDDLMTFKVAKKQIHENIP